MCPQDCVKIITAIHDKIWCFPSLWTNVHTIDTCLWSNDHGMDKRPWLCAIRHEWKALK